VSSDVAEAVEAARAILGNVQRGVDAGDVEALRRLFDDDAVLIGTSGDARDPDAIARYLAAVAELAGLLRWEWRDVVPFHVAAGELGFAAFGDLVLVDGDAASERREPIRVTLFAVERAAGWRLRQFHGSIPAGL
jgi:SnoaL-like domain